ncbi:MAG: LysM peptidoglycan-binding domain-containing protein [Gloeobacteraceae cyanobacterium ES-bin-144]|nr:LysM peptidoglycan-binding domain-containing protein [Verrucomicrobiales bacterium]
MTAIKVLIPLSITAAVISCSPQKANEYDTATAPYGPADSAQVNPPATAPANPVYDTPAAYDASTTAPAAPDSTAAVTPAAPSTNTPAPSAYGPATIHVVVKGDTLSGISAKYKIPAASIKQANKMTNDTVVLGRKMVIPPK